MGTGGEEPTHPDGDERGGVEGREQHGVAEHQDEADGERDLKREDKGGEFTPPKNTQSKCFPSLHRISRA